MTYEPRARGRLPVGVRTITVDDAVRGRSLDVELWYPTTDEHVGRDLDPATRDTFRMIPGMPAWPQSAVRDVPLRDGVYPLVVFSHGYSSHRRQSTGLMTHLASHGYVVAGVEHAGNTVVEVYMSTMGKEPAEARRIAVEGVIDSAKHRPTDVVAVLDALLGGAVGGVAAQLDGGAVGVVGHSFGGWTALSVPAIDPRVRSVVALAPAGGATPTYPAENPLTHRISLEWPADVPTLLVAAERDSILPLDGMRGLAKRVRGPLTMAVITGAEHLHFLDRAEELHELFRLTAGPALYEGRNLEMAPFAELCSEEAAATATASLTLAHLDGTLRGDGVARAWASTDTPLSARGLAATWESG